MGQPRSSAPTSGATGLVLIQLAGRMETRLPLRVYWGQSYRLESHSEGICSNIKVTTMMSGVMIISELLERAVCRVIMRRCPFVVSLVTECGPWRGPVQKRWCLHFLLFHLLFSVHRYLPLRRRCLFPSLCSIQAFLTWGRLWSVTTMLPYSP